MNENKIDVNETDLAIVKTKIMGENERLNEIPTLWCISLLGKQQYFCGRRWCFFGSIQI